MAQGRTPKVTDEEIIEVVRQYPQEDMLPATSTIKDELPADYGRKAVYRRLSNLEDEGRIGKIVVGEGRGNAVGWYVPGDAHLPGLANNSDSTAPESLDSPDAQMGIFNRVSPSGDLLADVYDGLTKDVGVRGGFGAVLAAGNLFIGLAVLLVLVAAAETAGILSAYRAEVLVWGLTLVLMLDFFVAPTLLTDGYAADWVPTALHGTVAVFLLYEATLAPVVFAFADLAATYRRLVFVMGVGSLVLAVLPWLLKYGIEWYAPHAASAADSDDSLGSVEAGD